MSRTNYCAKALDELNSVLGSSSGDPEIQYMAYIRESIKDSVKFRLPDGGHILPLDNEDELIGNIINKYIEHFKLPFDRIALEFDIVEKQNVLPVIILAYELDKHIMLDVLHYSSITKSFASHGFSVGMDENGLCKYVFGTKRSEHFFKNDRVAFDALIDSLSYYITVLIGFLASLSCGNTSISDDIPPDTKLNTSRRKKNKTPFYQYKVLTIGGNTITNQNGGADSIKHNSPRMHLRRGHIRRLPDKNIWVNSAVVGNRKNGIVDKEYLIKQHALA